MKRNRRPSSPLTVSEIADGFKGPISMNAATRIGYRCARPGSSLVWAETDEPSKRFSQGPGVYFTSELRYAEKYCISGSAIYVAEISGLLLPSQSLVDAHPDFVPPHPDVERLSSLSEYRSLVSSLQRVPRWTVATALAELVDELGPKKFLAAMRRIGVVGTAGHSGNLPEEFAVFDDRAIKLLEETPWKFTRNVKRKIASSEAFRRWFGDSVVVDDDGEPLVVYHGAKSSFDVFDFDRAVDLGMHFGTREQAEEAVEPLRERGIVRPFYLRLERPLRLRDPGDWIAPEGATMAPPVPTQLAELGLIDPETEDALLEPLYDAPRTWDYGSAKKRAALSKMLRDAIVELGFDGIVYENTFEEHGTGEDSLIAFWPEQIKLADGTNTTFDPGSANVRKNPSTPEERLWDLVDKTGSDLQVHGSGSVLWIDMISVPEASRSRGTGSKIVRLLEQVARNEGFTTIRLYAADTGDGRSNRFWEQLGYDYDDDDDWYMRKALGR